MTTTKQEVERMLSQGMIQLTPDELKHNLDKLGYYINHQLTFNYLNSSNKISYNAKSVSIFHNKTQKSFANIESPHNENFKKLQELRLNSFVFTAGKIWEL